MLKKSMKPSKKALNKFDNTLIDCLKSFWTNYTGWGRATRSEFWLGSIVYQGIIPILLYTFGFYTLEFIWCLLILIPSFTLSARRLHDINYSAWTLLWYICPWIGDIIIFVLACLKSQPEANQYGKPRI